MKEPLAPILVAFALINILLLDKLLENPRKTLLGDTQDIEQLRNRHAGIAADEMDDAMMRPPKAEIGEDCVGVGNEIAIGEEQKLDELDDLLLLAFGSRNYVSHIDIF